MTLTLETHVDLRLWELVGSGAVDALRAEGLPIPEAELTAVEHGPGFVACTGRNGYLIAGEEEWQQSPQTPPWLLQRSDWVMRLSGARWSDALTELCPHDLGRLPPGGWFMAAVAGVNAWLYRPASVPDSLLLGFDPSYGAYLESMLQSVVRDPSRINPS
ncbi:hypothetical protein [Aquisalimonas sp.]|uniref:hypothetical protein n=1 Tax=Aquisalimonas sp. TaxID=1872621 RepID=UPI0025BC5013|nr:hypothetical protein [Aquisalimonas sp.]